MLKTSIFSSLKNRFWDAKNVKFKNFKNGLWPQKRVFWTFHDASWSAKKNWVDSAHAIWRYGFSKICFFLQEFLSFHYWRSLEMFNSSKKNLAKNVRKIIFLRKAFRYIERLSKVSRAFFFGKGGVNLPSQKVDFFDLKNNITFCSEWLRGFPLASLN